MIIDAILDRKASGIYTQAELEYILAEAEIFNYDDIRVAFKRNDNAEIQEMLCNYISTNLYNPEIMGYVNKVDWTSNGFTG